MLQENKEYGLIKSVLNEHKMFCVTFIGDELGLTNRSNSVTLLLSRKPLPEHEQYVKQDESEGERYLLTKIRARVQRAIEFSLKIPQKNVRKSKKDSGVLDPTV
jgi:hypothetical protein